MPAVWPAPAQQGFVQQASRRTQRLLYASELTVQPAASLSCREAEQAACVCSLHNAATCMPAKQNVQLLLPPYLPEERQAIKCPHCGLVFECMRGCMVTQLCPSHTGDPIQHIAGCHCHPTFMLQGPAGCKCQCLRLPCSLPLHGMCCTARLHGAAKCDSPTAAASRCFLVIAWQWVPALSRPCSLPLPGLGELRSKTALLPMCALSGHCAQRARCCLTFLQKWPACSLRLVCSLCSCVLSLQCCARHTLPLRAIVQWCI